MVNDYRAPPKARRTDENRVVSISSLRRLVRLGRPGTNPELRPHTKIEEYVRRLEVILEDCPDLPITLSDLAQILDLERTYCCRAFQAATGKTFSEWIRGIRIRKAKVLLLQRDYSITDVCHAVGYNDITTFGRNFRKELGLTPSLFRRPHQDPVI